LLQDINPLLGYFASNTIVKEILNYISPDYYNLVLLGKKRLIYILFTVLGVDLSEVGGVNKPEVSLK
jgi:hypothetical protein